MTKLVIVLLGLAAPLAFAQPPKVGLTHLRGRLYVVEDYFYSKENSMVYVGEAKPSIRTFLVFFAHRQAERSLIEFVPRFRAVACYGIAMLWALPVRAITKQHCRTGVSTLDEATPM